MSNQVALSFEQILDWVEGRLSPSAVQAIEAQWVNATAEEQATLRWVQLFQRISQQTILVTPPAHLHQELTRRFAEYAERKHPSLLRRLVAALTFDSGLQPAMAGLRAATPNAAPEGNLRQWVFASEDVDVILNFQPSVPKAEGVLSGQILSNRDEVDVSDFALQLLQDDQAIALTTPDDLGEFRFEALPAGRYQLTLSGAEAEIELPVIEI